MTTANHHTSVLIVEDELITAQSIAELLEEEDYEIAGIAKTGQGALTICEQALHRPKVAVCDINIEGQMKGVELARLLKKQYGCEIVFLTAYSDTKTLQDAFEVDPTMYVVKPYGDVQLRVAVRMALHKVYKKENVAEKKSLILTEREKNIAHLVADGLSSKQVAGKLNISIETVKTHRKNMLQKNNLGNFAHLIYLMSK